MLVDAIMNPDVVTCSRDHTVLHAARMMREENVGTVIVVDESKRPIGLITDRDIAVKNVALDRSASTPVDEIMSHPVFAVPQNTLIFDMLREMARRKIHRVPIVDGSKKLIGVVSVDDALLLLTTEMANVAEIMSTGTRVLTD